METHISRSLWTVVRSVGDYFAEASSSPSSASLLLVDTAVKATILLAAATIVAAILRGASAAMRHRLWCLTFSSLVLLPVLSWSLPDWRIPILPADSAETPQQVDAISTQSSVNTTSRAVMSAASAEEEARTYPHDTTLAWESHILDGSSAHGQQHRSTPQFGSNRVLPQSDKSPDAPNEKSDSIGTHTINAVVFWFVGFMVALAPVAIGFVRCHRLCRQANDVTDGAWLALRDDLRGRLGLRRQVRLAEVGPGVVPMTCGIVRPAIILPQKREAWTARLRRFVLLHELAHVKRMDVAAQILARLACAMYWFHPLAWCALKRLRIERELACDDCVVGAGERSTDYARELLAIARNLQPARLGTAVAMAQQTKLETRVLALFDQARSHLPLSRTGARVLLVTAALAVTGIAVLRPAARTALSEEANGATDQTETGLGRPGSNDAASAPSSRVAGQVVDADGNPIAGARICVVRTSTEHGSWNQSAHLLAETDTGRDGRFATDFTADAPPFSTGEGFVQHGTVVVATADGHGLDWQAAPVVSGEQVTLRLANDSVPIEGRVLNLEGRPAEGVRVAVHTIYAADKGVDEWIAAARNNPATAGSGLKLSMIRWDALRPERPATTYYPSSKQFRLGDMDVVAATLTDRDGSFRLEGLGKDRLVHLEFSGENRAVTWVNVLTRRMPSLPYPVSDPRFRTQTCYGAQFDVTIEPDQPITGVVQDSSTHQPLAGVEVRIAQYADSLLSLSEFLSATTDAEGRYTLRGVPKAGDPARNHRLAVYPGPELPYFRMNFIDVPKSEGLGPATCDINLKKAVWVHGQVVDSMSGEPIEGLVSYYPFLDNPAAAEHSKFRPGMISMGYDDRYATDKSGVYRIPALPGRGVIVFFAAESSRYPIAYGADAIAGLRQQGERPLTVYHFADIDMTTAVREVDVPSGSESAECNFEVPPLDVAQLRFVDPGGESLVGVQARGLEPVRRYTPFNPNDEPDPLPRATAQIVALSEDSPRAVILTHKSRKLGAAVELTPREVAGNGPKAITLRDCGSITGRLVDEDGNPVGEATVAVGLIAPSDDGAKRMAPSSFSPPARDRYLTLTRTADDGRFRIDVVPPGVRYFIVGRSVDADGAANGQTEVVQPGATIDLGDVPFSVEQAGVDQQDKVDAMPSAQNSLNNATPASDDPVDSLQLVYMKPQLRPGPSLAETLRLDEDTISIRRQRPVTVERNHKTREIRHNP